MRRLRLASGADTEDAEESEDAEAGAIIEAEDATDVTTIRKLVQGYIDALVKAK